MQQNQKNELLYFWYTDIGDRYKINFTQENFKFIRNLNFLANEFIAVAVKNFSNYYTVITLSRFENQITGCGISCSDSIETALNNALVENKLIEWQNFKNNASKFYDYTSKHIVEISQFIDLKFNLEKSYTCNTKVDLLGDKDIILREDILTPEIILLNNRLGKSKTIKIVSKYFLNCIPSKEFIELSKGQGILQDININLKDFQVDCFIVYEKSMKGFLLNDARIFSQKGLFLNHHFNNYMVREDKQYVKSYEVGFNARASNLKKVFGEFFEREVLINSNDSQNSETVVNYLSENNSKYLAKGIFISKDRFVDSNGMASHTNSKEVIKTAFFEFFERQSFLTNFLSQTAVPRLLFGNEESLIIADNYLKNYVDKINYYDVSLDRSLHVVLCIGYGSKKCIGLGTSTQIKEAIKKSQIEALQYFAQDISKFNSKDMLDNLSHDENDFYHEKFDQLSVEDFIKNYSYLLHNNLISKQVMDQENSFVLPDFLEKIKKDFNINPVIAMFESDQTIPHLKIVKIYDENWFPHMNPNFYNKEVYKFVSKSINKDLLTSIKYIPFP